MGVGALSDYYSECKIPEFTQKVHHLKGSYDAKSTQTAFKLTSSIGLFDKDNDI